MQSSPANKDAPLAAATRQRSLLAKTAGSWALLLYEQSLKRSFNSFVRKKDLARFTDSRIACAGLDFNGQHDVSALLKIRWCSLLLLMNDNSSPSNQPNKGRNTATTP